MLRDVLERQQAQLKTASKQLEKASKKTLKQVAGEDDNERNIEVIAKCEETIKEDLAQLSNREGCWDDSDDEDNEEMHHSASVATFATTSSAQTKDGAIQDAWDL